MAAELIRKQIKICFWDSISDDCLWRERKRKKPRMMTSVSSLRSIIVACSIWERNMLGRKEGQRFTSGYYQLKLSRNYLVIPQLIPTSYCCFTLYLSTALQLPSWKSMISLSKTVQGTSFSWFSYLKNKQTNKYKITFPKISLLFHYFYYLPILFW